MHVQTVESNVIKANTPMIPSVSLKSLPSVSNFTGLDNFVSGVEALGFGGYYAYKNQVKLPNLNLKKFPPLTHYDSILRSSYGAIKGRVLSSTLRNAFQVIRGSRTVKEGVSYVTADVVSSGINTAVSTAAANAATYLASKTGISSFPIMVVGIITGMVTSYASDKFLVKKTGLYDKVAVSTHRLLDKVF